MLYLLVVFFVKTLGHYPEDQLISSRHSNWPVLITLFGFFLCFALGVYRYSKKKSLRCIKLTVPMITLSLCVGCIGVGAMFYHASKARFTLLDLKG